MYLRLATSEVGTQVELDTAFIDAGMDSLSGVSLVSMLNRDFQTALTPSVAPGAPRAGLGMMGTVRTGDRPQS